MGNFAIMLLRPYKIKQNKKRTDTASIRISHIILISMNGRW